MKFLLIFLLCNLINGYSSVILPSVIWDPWNQIFSCDPPTIKVHITNKINFLCPITKLHSYLPDNSKADIAIYENLYFLGTDKVAFDSCDATNGKQLLNCDAEPANTKVYNLNIVETAGSSKSFEFVAGETYYLIGTGFRKLENLTQNIGGSCNTIEKQGQYKLRLKIYVCTKADIDAGQCELCRSQGCYYKECTANCSQWNIEQYFKTKDSPQENNCTVVKKRICVNTLIGDSRVEYSQHYIECSTNCSSWRVEENVIQHVQNICYTLYNRTCIQTLIGDFDIEYKKVKVDCQQNCTQWSNHSVSSTSPNNCTNIEKRVCNEYLLGKTTTEYKQTHIDCVTKCTAWKKDMSKIFKLESGGCEGVQTRTCVNHVLSESRTETNITPVDCPKVPIGPQTPVPRVGDEATATGDRNMIIAIVATIGFFIIGIVFGILCHKKYHSRSCMNKKRVGVGGDFGIENDGYDTNTLNRYSNGVNGQHMNTLNDSPALSDGKSEKRHVYPK